MAVSNNNTDPNTAMHIMIVFDRLGESDRTESRPYLGEWEMSKIIFIFEQPLLLSATVAKNLCQFAALERNQLPDQAL